MGCGCGKNKVRRTGTVNTQATSASSVPPQVQRATYADNARVVRSQATPYRNGKTIVRKVV